MTGNNTSMSVSRDDLAEFNRQRVIASAQAGRAISSVEFFHMIIEEKKSKVI